MLLSVGYIMEKHEFISRATEKHGTDYDYTNVPDVVKYGELVSIDCVVHGTFQQSVDNHLTGRGCKKCGIQRAAELRSTNSSDFIAKAKLTHGDKYDYSKIPKLFRVSDKIPIVCNIHGIFTQTANSHCSGRGCRKCGISTRANSRKTKKSDFIAKANCVHNGMYDYSLVPDKIRTKDKIQLKCSIHGVFEQNTQNHLHGHGCKLCADEQKSITKDEFVQRSISHHGDFYDYSKVPQGLLSSTEKVEIICKKHGSFYQFTSIHMKHSGCPSCAIGKQTSSHESDLFSIIGKYGFTQNNREVIKPFEIDLFSENHKFGIEINGVYWHSSGSTANDKSMSEKHVMKTDLMESNGYALFHVFENELIENRPIVDSMILSRVGKSKRIYARKCKIIDVDVKSAIEFLNANHLQGACGSTHRYGLEHNGELVALITFGKSRYGKSNTNSIDYELIRFCNKLGINTVGGASKLLKHFTRTHYFDTIKSYANRRWSTGNLYEKLGFEFSHNSKPCYWYTKGNRLYHRSMFMKHKLNDRLSNFDPSMTEVENMYLNGYRRIWDCGNKVYFLRNNNTHME